MKKIIRYLNPKNLLLEIEMYGYQYSWRKQVSMMAGFVLGFVALARLLGLTNGQMISLIFIVFLFVPRLILNTYINLYEQKKFMDVSNYLEQMLYSFRRKSKITSALEDVAILFPSGQMGEAIEKTYDFINHGSSEGNIYKEAFAKIEEIYDCDIVRRVHEFMIRVEISGGEHEGSADLLIQDRNRWVSRILSTQKEKQLVKRNVTIGIVLALLVILGTVFMVPQELVDVKSNLLSQISSWITLALCFFLWFFVQVKLSGSWIKPEEIVTDEQAESYYERVMCPVEDKVITRIILLIVGVALTVSLMCMMSPVCGGAVGVIYIYFIMTKKNRAYRLSKKRLQREVEKAFPDWMLSLSLLLQTENVQRAILQSVDMAPVVLLKELQILQDKIEQRPTDIEPYLEFYEVLGIPDIQSAMRMLYSMSQTGGEEVSKQVHALVERNCELQDQSQRMKTEDYLAGMGVCVLIPMLIGCMKLLIDMGILMYGLMNQTQGFF